MKHQKRASAPNTALLREKLGQFLLKFTFGMPKHTAEPSVFAVQLREPDYWIILTGFEPDGSSRFQILFDGPWKIAVNYFSEKASLLPSPKFMPFPTHKGDTDFGGVCQAALHGAVVGLPKALISGDSSLSIYPAGIFVLKHGGVLLEATNFYFEAWFRDNRPPKNRSKKPLFEPGRERKAFFCRFPIPLSSKRSRLAFKAKLYRDLEHDRELIGERGKVRTFLFGDKVKILLFPNGLIVADERHRDRALDALGSVLSYSFFRGAGCAPASAQDIGRITINGDGTIGGSSGDLPPARLKMRSTISASKLNAIFRGLGKGVEFELSLDLRLLHQAVFHLWVGEHLQSFTLAWTVLERRISQLWRCRMSEKGYSGGRLNELCESERYTMSVIIDMLEVANELTSQQTMGLHSLRKSRNKAMHEGRTPTREMALECLHLAIEFTGKHWKGLQFDLETLQAASEN